MKKTIKKKKVKNELYLELNGVVNIIDITNGKKTITPMDGELILKILLHAIEDGMKAKLATK